MNEDRRKGDRRVSPAVAEFALQERGELLARIEDQALEIERLKEAKVIVEIAASSVVEAKNTLERELAALKAQPSGVVQWPGADEIMQTAFEEGQPGDDASGYYFELEEFDLFIQRLMEEVARLNASPASADGVDERATPVKMEQDLDAVALCGCRIVHSQKNGNILVQCAQHARAALTASAPNHSEQVRKPTKSSVRDLLLGLDAPGGVFAAPSAGSQKGDV